MPLDVSHIIQESGIPSKSPMLVGVSGGADSMVLAHLLHQHGIPIAIGHCNFQLREKDAMHDEALVARFAHTHNIPFHQISFDTEKYARSKRISIQMAARTLRYKWFEKICRQFDYAGVVVGTHLTDRIETFLFNATKGTGIAGLRGIKKYRDGIYRPLIDVSKSAIYSYARTHQIPFREDQSNNDTKYARNRIRHHVLPELAQINPQFEEAFKRNFERLTQAEDYLNAHLTTDWNSWIYTKKNDAITLSGTRIIAHESALLVLQHGLRPFGLSETQVSNLWNALMRHHTAQFITHSHRVVVERNEVVIVPQKKSPLGPDTFLIREFLGEITHPISLKFTDSAVHNLVIQKNKNHAYFDFDTLRFPLTLRPWKNGDTLKPYGMKGSKKVSDIINEAKIPTIQKPEVYVLEHGNEILWVIGLRASRSFKVTPETTRIYAIEHCNA